MTVLRMQHPVADYDRWKRAFDSDPLDRAGSGVRSYVIHRSLSEPVVVFIDLEFDDADDAQAMLFRLHQMWTVGPAGILDAPEAWVLEAVERVDGP